VAVVAGADQGIPLLRQAASRQGKQIEVLASGVVGAL